MSFGFLILPHFNSQQVEELLDAAPPIVGFIAENWDLRAWLAGRLDPQRSRLYYRPLRAGVGAPGWWHHFRDKPVDEQVALWLDFASKDGDSLQRIIDDMAPHRPIVQVFNEEFLFLNDVDLMARYSAFSAAMAERLWDMGAEAAVGGWSTGTLDRRRVAHMKPMLDACRDGIALFEYHDYAPIWPEVWKGRNQSEGVVPEASEEEKWDAILQDPFPDNGNPASWLPSYLIGRIWGMPAGDGSFGIPDLFDVPLLLGEGVVDNIADHRLPRRANGDFFGGWFTAASQVSQRLGIAQDDVAVEGLKRVDDFLDRMVGPGAEPQVALRMAFAVGPGHSFANHDLCRTPGSFRAYRDYLQAGT